MRIISQTRISEAKCKYRNCANALDAWRKLMKNNEFKNFADLKSTFGSVDKVHDKYVFDIGGNKLRLIVHIDFSRSNKVFIKEILTHAQYDKNKWKS